MIRNEVVGKPAVRQLGVYDVLVRRNEAVLILDKVTSFYVNGEPAPNFGNQYAFISIVKVAATSLLSQTYPARISPANQACISGSLSSRRCAHAPLLTAGSR